MTDSDSDFKRWEEKFCEIVRQREGEKDGDNIRKLVILTQKERKKER